MAMAPTSRRATPTERRHRGPTSCQDRLEHRSADAVEWSLGKIKVRFAFFLFLAKLTQCHQGQPGRDHESDEGRHGYR